MNSQSKKPEAVMLLGPTATGKTDLALKLAQEFPIEIISVDSALIYKGMDIGTAKPTLAERSLCPHHLIDILEPTESYSAANFVEDAERLIQEIRDRGKLPVLVGGTMLYAKALLEGISELPASSPESKEAMRQKIQKVGLDKVYEKLKEIDPETAERLPPGDTQRISRAMEVYELTGRPLSSFFGETKGSKFAIATLGLMPSDRKELHARIEKRFDQMLEDGFIDEVKSLMELPGLNANLPSMRCVGYRQAWEYLTGQRKFEDFRLAGIAATRQLAKRQMTWLRSMKTIVLMEPSQPGTVSKLKDLLNQM